MLWESLKNQLGRLKKKVARIFEVFENPTPLEKILDPPLTSTKKNATEHISEKYKTDPVEHNSNVFLKVGGGRFFTWHHRGEIVSMIPELFWARMFPTDT